MENFIRGQAWALPPVVGRWAEDSLHPGPRELTPYNVTLAGGLLEPCCPPARLPVGLCAAQPPTDAERCRWPTHAGVPCPSLTAEPGPRVPAPCLD